MEVFEQILFAFFVNQKPQPIQKKHAVQQDKTGGWNFSNFRRHVLRWHPKEASEPNDSVNIDNPLHSSIHDNPMHSTPIKHIESPNETTSPTNKAVALFSESDIFSMPLVFSDEKKEPDQTNQNECVEATGIMGTLYAQFSTQNLELIKATVTNGEKRKCMVLKIGDHCVDVNILNMNSDRNCMFYALVHQLQYVKVNSNEHMEATIRLRQCVIEEIENNFDKYKQALKVRLCYNNGTNEIKQNVSDDECQEFISTNLTKDRFWGGQETNSQKFSA